ncbi:uncharacterized protein F4807DRAFT_256725 [Annulohypoxylon truncatum]|uniref:uncharacterized protein n=1 Tax=Annulohypoxylon truncatum TaxID=327061 RepID=UPI002008ACD3|nr:uncharacterized protein F4807DRAFT_256725 [Annulohypoxylon truncatum]KAI1213262.1 hypothetical protein F4807DRAFT_256725 [Annulohypoxylon truncatum]
MESNTIQRKATLHSSFPLRTLQPQSSQLNFGRLPSPFWHKGADGTTRRTPITPIPEPPYSPTSDSSRASFSQASNTDSWDITSTAPSLFQDSSADSWEIISNAPSSPQTPCSKYELDETPIKLESIPPHRGTLKHRRDGLDEASKDIKLPVPELPSLNHVLARYEHRNYHPSSRPRARSLNGSCASPVPKNEHTLSNRLAHSLSEDPIVQCLNLWRKESGDTKSLLSQPRIREGSSILHIDLDFREPAPVLRREKRQYTPLLGDRCRRSPPGEEKEEPKDDAKTPHNNVKYSIEETDYIRFNRYEKKLSWEEGKRLFREKFPMNREKQGIQGVHYRDNMHVPHLVDGGRTLVFLENGHIEGVQAQVRQQGEAKQQYGLTHLYPERALLYDWVPLEFKQIAARLVKERVAQREAKKRELIATGKWKEKDDTGTCACCPKPDRKRDEDKQFTPKRLPGHRLSRPKHMRGHGRLYDARYLSRSGMDTAFYPREYEAKRRKFGSENI